MTFVGGVGPALFTHHSQYAFCSASVGGMICAAVLRTRGDIFTSTLVCACTLSVEQDEQRTRKRNKPKLQQLLSQPQQRVEGQGGGFPAIFAVEPVVAGAFPGGIVALPSARTVNMTQVPGLTHNK